MAAIVPLLKRLWRATVLVLAALCFLLALFLNYDGLGQALGLSTFMTGMAGRVLLAGIAAFGVAVVMARFGREPAPARKAPRGKKPATLRKALGKNAKAAPKTARRKPASQRPAASRPSSRRR